MSRSFFFLLVSRTKDSQKVFVLVACNDHGKTTNFSTIQYTGTIIYCDYCTCTLNALEMYLFYERHIANKDFSELTNKGWFDQKVVKYIDRNKSMTKHPIKFHKQDVLKPVVSAVVRKWLQVMVVVHVMPKLMVQQKTKCVCMTTRI